MPPCHVAIFVSYAPSLLNFRGPLIRTLRASGATVTALAPDFDDATRQTLGEWDVKCHQVPLSRRGLNPLEDLQTLRAMAVKLRALRPDLLLTYTIKPNIWGAFAAERAGVPSIACVTGLGYAFSAEGGSLRERAVRAMGRRLYARATRRNARVIFQNSNDRDDFIAAGCLADIEKARIVNGSGVDMDHYARVPLPDAPVFLMISRLLGEKGVREYAEASIALKALHPEARCLLAGFMDAGLDAIAQDEVNHWTTEGLEYLGPQDDVRPVLAEASVYVLPSYREGTPRSVLEAMAMGRPVITTDAPGCRETVHDLKTGFLVPVRDAGAVVNRMSLLAADAALRERMGTEGYHLAREKYDAVVVNRRMMEHMDLAV